MARGGPEQAPVPTYSFIKVVPLVAYVRSLPWPPPQPWPQGLRRGQPVTEEGQVGPGGPARTPDLPLPVMKALEDAEPVRDDWTCILKGWFGLPCGEGTKGKEGDAGRRFIQDRGGGWPGGPGGPGEGPGSRCASESDAGLDGDERQESRRTPRPLT